MINPKASAAFITLSAFLCSFLGAPMVEAQTVAASTNTIPNYTPASMFGLTATQTQVSGSLTACDMQFPTTGGIGGLLGAQGTGAQIGAAGAQNSFGAKLGQGGTCDQLSVPADPNAVKSGSAGDLSGTYYQHKSVTADLLGTSGSSASMPSGFNCQMTCVPPAGLSDPSCADYTGTTGGELLGKSTKYLAGGQDAATQDLIPLNRYVYFLQLKQTFCGGESLKAVQAQYNNYKCKMDALGKAVGGASTQLQSALNMNNQNFTKMTQFQNQVGDQMSQIDQILGPDPSDPNAKGGTNSQFGGLLGVQAALNQKLPTWTTNAESYKSTGQQITQAYAANTQSLNANEMTQVVDCMKGNTDLGVNGGRSLTCFKPIMTTPPASSSSTASSAPVPATDSNGNVKYSQQACGALEYVRSQLVQAGLKNGLKSQSNVDQGNMYGTEFDSMINSMERDMGATDPSDASGNKTLVTRMPNWSDISNKYAGDMAQLYQSTGINVQAQMNTVANNCYNSGTSWKNQQLNSSASPYNVQKTKIDGQQDTLKGQYTTGFSDMNGELSSAISALGGTSNAQVCNANGDITKMQACYDKLKNNLQNTLNGTGTAGTSVKTVTGGSMVSSFAVSCRGINNCVNSYKDARSQKKTQLSNAKKATEDFVNTGNTTIQNQLQSFATYLGGLQQQVTAQFGNMQSTLAAMGVESSAQPKYMEGEQLQAGGKDGAGGPYQNPKSMAAVLSGMVQPTGLINFQDSGMQQALNDATKQANSTQKDASKDLSQYSRAQTKLAAIAKGSCENLANGVKRQPGSNSAGSTIDPQSCAIAIQQCATTERGMDPAASGTAVSSFTNDLFADLQKMKDSTDALADSDINNLRTEAQNISGTDCLAIDECKALRNSKTDFKGDDLNAVFGGSATGK
jgi:hypothetical protein